MIVTLDWLKEKSACKSGIDWCAENKLIDLPAKEFTQKLVDAEQFDWAYWLIKRVLPVKELRMLAVFAAEQVLDIFEKKHPDDKRPRLAIEAAKKAIENDTEENRKAAAAADDATYAAYAAVAAAADDATYAAYATAAAVAAAADDATYAAYAAVAVAAYAAYAADERKEMKVKILTYAISLIAPTSEQEER